MGIGIVLQNLLCETGSNVNEVAQATGISPSTLYSIIRRDSMSANIEDLYKVAHYLGVSLDYFYVNQAHDQRQLAFTTEERELLYTFRNLDAFGKRLVRMVANEEESRCKPDRDMCQITPLETTSNCVFLQLSEQPASAGTGVYLGPEAFRTIKVVENDKTRLTAFCVRVSGDSMDPLFSDGDIVMVSRDSVQVGDIALVTLNSNGYIKRLGNGCLLSENKKYDPIPCNEETIVNGRVIGILQPEWILEM